MMKSTCQVDDSHQFTTVILYRVMVPTVSSYNSLWVTNSNAALKRNTMFSVLIEMTFAVDHNDKFIKNTLQWM